MPVGKNGMLLRKKGYKCGGCMPAEDLCPLSATALCRAPKACLQSVFQPALHLPSKKFPCNIIYTGEWTQISQQSCIHLLSEGARLALNGVLAGVVVRCTVGDIGPCALPQWTCCRLGR